MSELINKVSNMVDDLVAELGLKKDEVFDPEKKTWKWSKGSANIEVLLLSVPVGEGKQREFLQVASPLMRVPQGNEKTFFRRLLELNDVKLGIKLSIQSGSDQVWALYERDLVGIDYTELKTTVLDLEYWADELDDILINEFGGSK